jgi:hypothetical protein
MPATSQTLQYTTAVALALDKLHKKIADAVSTSNTAFEMIKKAGNWEGTDEGGPQLRVPIMYQLQALKPLGAYGTVNINPINGDTAGFYAWGQTAAHVSFSDMEDFQMRGSLSLEKIVKAKQRQAEASLSDIFERALTRGQANIDTTSITQALTSSDDGSTFIVPLGHLIAYDPTAALTVGGIDQSANAWWQNQTLASAATTLAGFLGELRKLYTRCQRGGGVGKTKNPDFHLCDERTFNIFEQALAVAHRNPSYERADIAPGTVAFKGSPVSPNELLPDAANSSTTMTEGTWYMGNSNILGFTYDKRDSFKTGASVRPANQLVNSALMPVRGALWTSNRKKLGVMGSIGYVTLEAASS